MKLRARAALTLIRWAYTVDFRIANEFSWQVVVRDATHRARLAEEVRRLLAFLDEGRESKEESHG